MATMNVSIPESMRKFVEEKIAREEFTASEYIRHLIRMDQERENLERRAQIAQYLALCEQQIAKGKYKIWDKKRFLQDAQTHYKKTAKRK